MQPVWPLAGAPCVCGRRDARSHPLAWAQCCGRHLPATPGNAAPDAECLMRSRYSAFVCGDSAYLLASWHPRHRPAQLELEPGVKWLGLDVRAHRVTGPDAAEVEFVARQRDRGGRASRLHELSRFVRENGRWYYLDGDLR